jgi:hypothetical protein
MLVDGTKLDGVKDLRTAMLRYSPQFVRVATEKLLIYALGRGTEYFDMPLIRSIVHESQRNNYKFSSLVLGVVKSEPFQMNGKLQISSERKPAQDKTAESKPSETRPVQQRASAELPAKAKASKRAL